MKKLSLVISFLIAFILFANCAYATVSANIVATASKPELKQGEEFTVSVYLDNLSFTNKGVDEVELKVDINKDVLNAITVDNIVTKNGNVTIGNDTLKVEDVKTATQDQVVFSDLTTDCDYKIFIDLKTPLTNTKTKLLDIKFTVKDTVDASKIDVNIEDAISLSADIITQVTAADLNNGLTADTGKAVSTKVPVKITAEKANESNTTDNNIPTENTNVQENTNDNKTVENTSKENNTSKEENKTQNTNGNTNQGTNVSGNTGKNTSGNTNQGTTGNGSTSTKAGGSSSAGSVANNQVGGSGATQTSNTAQGVLPAAGFKLFILPVVVVLAVLIYSYRKYSEYKMIK